TPEYDLIHDEVAGYRVATATRSIDRQPWESRCLERVALCVVIGAGRKQRIVGCCKVQGPKIKSLQRHANTIVVVSSGNESRIVDCEEINAALTDRLARLAAHGEHRHVRIGIQDLHIGRTRTWRRSP